MKQNRTVIHYSILAILLWGATAPANAAIKVNNLSRPNRASMYQQINADALNAPKSAHVNDTTASTAPTAAATELPVRVSNPTLAAKMATGDPNVAGIDMLQACANIYPNGEFEWATPTAGYDAGHGSTCVSVVELRGYQMGENGSDIVLARAKLAAGDSFKCNISDFPPESYTAAADASKFTFPNDSEPTMDDVIAVMNQEQKQNAGLKIAASVLVGGLGGNIAGDNEVGKDGLLGGGRDKTKSTIIGALGAGAVTTASIYSGKVAGDTIMSAGINMAAGGVVGNIMSTGDAVLRIEESKLPGQTADTTSCLWGVLKESKALQRGAQYYVNFTNDSNVTYVCPTDGTACVMQPLIAIQIDVEIDGKVQRKTLADLAENDFADVRVDGCRKYCYSLNSDGEFELGDAGNEHGLFLRIASAGIPGQEMDAMVCEVKDKPLGIKRSEWTEMDKSGKKIYGRNRNGDGFDIPDSDKYSMIDFYPMVVDADDGGIIDLGNKARLKATLTGVGVGGALGAYSGYQGAQDEVSARWVAAVREYKDSLQKVVCMTGNRFLGFYNDTVVIPNMLSE